MTTTSDIARQTALVLASLPPREREWLLARLAPPRRARLAALIDDAQHLGFEPGGVMLPALIDALERRAHPEDARAALDLARVDTLLVLLADAPAHLIARLLSAHPWRWREAFIARFTGPQKHALLAALHEPHPCPPKLADALIEELAAKLGKTPDTRAPTARKSRLKAFASAFPMLRKPGVPR